MTDDTPMPTWDQVNQRVGALMAVRGEWCGFPLPMAGMRLTVEARNPWAEKVHAIQAVIDEDARQGDAHVPADEGDDWTVANSWWSHRTRQQMVIARNTVTGHYRGIGLTYDYAQKVRMLIDSLRVADVWPLAAEVKAIETLQTLIKPHLFEKYMLTGAFLEISRRSGLVYIFRKSRPTLAYNAQRQRVLAALCLHPIAYYEDTHAGAMVPTDDVIAHLLLMRGDEPMFWRRANQHHPSRPEAGL